MAWHRNLFVPTMHAAACVCTLSVVNLWDRRKAPRHSRIRRRPQGLGPCCTHCAAGPSDLSSIARGSCRWRLHRRGANIEGHAFGSLRPDETACIRLSDQRADADVSREARVGHTTVSERAAGQTRDRRGTRRRGGVQQRGRPPGGDPKGCSGYARGANTCVRQKLRRA